MYCFCPVMMPHILIWHGLFTYFVTNISLIGSWTSIGLLFFENLDHPAKIFG